MAVPWDNSNMLSSELLSSDLARAAYSVAGMMSDADATAMREDMVEAIVELQVCWWNLLPAMKQHPRTRRMFERMLPSMLACTIRISLFLRAIMLTWAFH